jgi:hypothetical protein
MNRAKCIEVLNTAYPLESAPAQAFLDKLNSTSFSKHELLLKSEEVCNKLWFINKGLVRGYYNYRGKDITSWFATENQFFYAADSFLNQKPGDERIQALENTDVSFIYFEDLYLLYDLYPSINHAGRIFAERYRLLNHERLVHMRMLSAKERLELFARSNRSLFLRAPQKHIASHIGISEGYVSELLGRFLI